MPTTVLTPYPLIRQMKLYASLVHLALGEWPTSLAVFSLFSGVRQIEVDPDEVATLVAEVAEVRDAWDAGQRQAYPDRSHCTFCSRRLGCEPYWQAAATWEDPSAVQGTILEVVPSDSGRVAVHLGTDRGREWLTHVAVSQNLQGRAGCRLRAMFVKRVPEADDSSGQNWRASELSEVAIDPVHD